MKTIILSCFLLLLGINLFGENKLTVGDPRNSWYTSKGTIDEASLTIRPKGLFMEYGLYLTFSSKNSYWTNPNDTVEVTLRFDLPGNAIVTDSWLWIGNDIIKAKLLDKWTATSIYENIVKRRRDPSILMKQSATQYELRVFPMAGNQTRKVKITYLMPISWNKSQAMASLPTAILNTSSSKPSFFHVFTWSNDTWKEPKLLTDPAIEFVNKSDVTFGNYKEAIIPSSPFKDYMIFKDNIKIAFNAPLLNGIYFSESMRDNEGTYQLAIFPDQFFDFNVSKKAAILVDYDASNSNVTPKELLSALKNEMLMNLSSKDSFNLILSNLIISRYSNKWVAATSANIEAAFNSLNNPLSSYSNLGALLGNGIDFIKNNGNNGKIILVSDGDQYDNYQVANVLINDLLQLMNPKIPIHISDYQSLNYSSNFNNGQYYYGNDYFYINLTKMTLGSYHTVRNNLNLSGTINGAFKFLGGSITSFDLHTSMKTGFCYSRYNLNSTSNIAYVNDAILQVGKFKGDFPFLVEISGEYNNEIFSQIIQIEKPIPTENPDTIAEAIWAGQYIKKLESGTQSNDIINEIVYSSLNERILSLYTSFLCLEDTSYICNNCKDESQLALSVDKVLAGNDSLKVYPNPFGDKLSIELDCKDPGDVKEFSIVELTGALVYQFHVGELHKGSNLITWNGLNASGNKVKPGVYLLIYKTSTAARSIKIVRGR